jgi:hypothetical protein
MEGAPETLEGIVAPRLCPASSLGIDHLVPVTSLGYDACSGIMLVGGVGERSRVGGEVVYLGRQATGVG